MNVKDVKDVMVEDLQWCSIFDNLNGAARLMWEHDCGVNPVVAPDDRVVGMVTDRDVCMGAYTKGRPPISIPVTEVMARDVRTCRPEVDVSDVLSMMASQRVRRVPDRRRQVDRFRVGSGGRISAKMRGERS